MANERPQLGFVAVGGDPDRCFLASLAGDAPRALVIEPAAVDDKARKRLRQPCDQILSGCGRKIVARQQRIANDCDVAEPFGHAIDRERSDFGAVVFRQNLTSLGIAEFGKRGRCRSRQHGAAGNRGLNRLAASCNPVDEIGIDQKRR